MESFTLETRQRVEFISITRQINEGLKNSKLLEGAVMVYVPHTTAGVTINENADPNVLHDLGAAMARILPDMPEFRHAEGNSDAHCRSSLMGCSVLIPVESNRLALGTWQDVYFCEFDGPRRRRVIIQFLASAPRL